MPSVLTCIAGGHDLRFVAVALVLCILGSHLAMRLLARVRRNTGARRLNLLFLAGLVAGGTVWTTHFTAMLGYQIPVARSFEFGLTLLSLGLAIILSLAGFALSARSTLGPTVEIGGAMFGGGIALMHYCGMAAYTVAGLREWNEAGIVVSILCGVCFGALATNRIARPVNRFCKYGGSLAMVLAIATTHFTSMGSLTIIPLDVGEFGLPVLSDVTLVVTVTAGVTVFLAMAASAYVIDLQAARETTDTVEHLALHDALTGLSNRHHLARRLAALIGCNVDDTARIVYVALDLDRLRDVNDFRGHEAGDAVLRSLAQRARATFSSAEFLARSGGDEFVAIKSDAFSRSDALRFGERVLALCAEPIVWNGQSFEVGVNIGIALYPEHGRSIEQLASCADLALLRAKTLGRNRMCSYDATMDEAGRDRASLAIDLRRALADGEFELHYQAQNDSRTRAIVGFEALLRWNHPVRGRVSPAEFIPIAESTGLIVEIGGWVLRTACATAANWPVAYKVAVNVAPLQLARGDLQLVARDALAATGLPPERLEIELTETGIIADQQHACATVQALKDIGITVAMDDFGTGYSSLATLRTIPFDKIKIDRSFVQDAGTNVLSTAIVHATILLAKSLGIPVLAEGVETEEQLAFLRDADCASVQGFLFGKPMSADVVSALCLAQIRSIEAA